MQREGDKMDRQHRSSHTTLPAKCRLLQYGGYFHKSKPPAFSVLYSAQIVMHGYNYVYSGKDYLSQKNLVSIAF